MRKSKIFTLCTVTLTLAKTHHCANPSAVSRNYAMRLELHEISHGILQQKDALKSFYKRGYTSYRGRASLLSITDALTLVVCPFASRLVALCTFCSLPLEAVVPVGFIEPAAAAAAADDSESPRFLTKRTECISISGDILRRRGGRILRGDFRLRGELVSLITVSGS